MQINLPLSAMPYFNSAICFSTQIAEEIPASHWDLPLIPSNDFEDSSAPLITPSDTPLLDFYAPLPALLAKLKPCSSQKINACRICLKTFPTRSGWFRHLRTTHLTISLSKKIHTGCG
ncbi:hypothetical protein DSO57_1026442 [Entomophthora muscae]|uniref:Uncharacterized protein n=1 Tax=Entomophthora muscae TaxID=34485 RepID=A0ACC2RSZ6_9FUNG|nr:hypothetical protein DSO57_1026442 [Entomophthora muscae]